MFPEKKKNGGAYCHRCVLSSEIDVDNKCSFRQGPVNQGLSRLFWKVQGHSEHIKESNFNISSYLMYPFHQKLIIIEHTNYFGQRSLSHFWEVKVTQSMYCIWGKNSYFNSVNSYLITYSHDSIVQLSFRQCSLKVILAPFARKNFPFQQFLNRHWLYSMQTNYRLIYFRQSSLKSHSKKVKVIQNIHLLHRKKMWFHWDFKLLICWTKIPQGITEGHLERSRSLKVYLICKANF
jgi:hypothetical protein